MFAAIFEGLPPRVRGVVSLAWWVRSQLSPILGDYWVVKVLCWKSHQLDPLQIYNMSAFCSVGSDAEPLLCIVGMDQQRPPAMCFFFDYRPELFTDSR